MFDSFEAHKRVADDIANAYSEGYEQGKRDAQQWIPCSERLPEDDTIMLVTCETKRGIKTVNRAYYSDGFWHGSGSMSGVIAWMPLPEPFKGVTE